MTTPIDAELIDARKRCDIAELRLKTARHELDSLRLRQLLAAEIVQFDNHTRRLAAAWASGEPCNP